MGKMNSPDRRGKAQIGSHSNLASQDNERLILRWVPMDGNHSPWLHSIQKTMAFILQRLVEALCRDHAQ